MRAAVVFLTAVFTLRAALGVLFQAPGAAGPVLVPAFGMDWTQFGTLVGLFWLPGLFLARVDGKSPVEYLTDDNDKNRVRRVARALLDMAEDDEGRRVIRSKVSRQDLAKVVGASREMVSRVMKDLEERGLIETQENGWVVLTERLATQ